MPKVCAVIPNCNRRILLESILRDLSRQTRPPDEVVVVDNGSEDGSAAAAEALGARVLRLVWNAGFARAVNLGVRESAGEYLAVLNNDVELDERWLEGLLIELETSDAWFATGKIVRQDDPDVIDGSFDEVSRSGCAWRCGEGRRDGPLWNTPSDIDLAPFTAAVFRRDLFTRVGPLDERFESYLEDVDFGLRCAASGLRGRYVPEAVARHHGSATLGTWNGEKVRLLARNQVFLVAKHYPERWWWRLGWPVVAGQLLWGLVAAWHGAGWPYCLGKWQGLRAFRTLRRAAERPAAISRILADSEERIRRLQEATGFDRYWRLYFALT